MPEQCTESMILYMCVSAHARVHAHKSITFICKYFPLIRARWISSGLGLVELVHCKK